MTMQKPIPITLLVVSFAGCALLAFMGGKSFSEGRGSVQSPSPVSMETHDAKDADIRTELQEDGTRILWIRASDGGLLTQYRFDAEGALSLKTVYRISTSGSPMSCKIFDDQKTEIFRVRYGYRKSDGMLVEEQVFDSRIKRLNDQGVEMPVRRVLHHVDAGSGASKPTSIDLASVDFPAELEMGFENPFQDK